MEVEAAAGASGQGRGWHRRGERGRERASERGAGVRIS